MSGDLIGRVRGLHVTLEAREGVVHALRGVDLDLFRGEIVALVGESGSGKSVLGACLLGMPPSSRATRVDGSVEVAGIDMLRADDSTLRAFRRRRLGAVFQDPMASLNPSIRIGRQLTERGIDDAGALAALTDAGVPEPVRRAAQWPHELSGGLRQRVMIGMALSAPDGPELIIADEPTTALDVSVQAQIITAFDRLRRERECSILLVTHDLGVAAAVADRIVVLYAGRVCEVGSAADVLRSPRHPYTAALLAARLSVDAAASPVPIGGMPPSPFAPRSGCAFAPRCRSVQPDCSRVLPEVVPVEAEADPGADAGGSAVACLHPCTAASAAASGVSPVVPVGSGPAVSSDTSVPDGPADVEPALRIDAVAKAFPVGRGSARRMVQAVADVSLSVPSRGALALVGESGCGKTTLLRMATGILTPDSGRVEWPATSAAPQMVFQDAGASLTPWLSIERQIVERLAAAGVAKSQRSSRCDELLDRVGLDPRAGRRRPRELSGGQRQRAAIARALASNPGLLICDEPVSALDASLAVRVLELLEELRSSLGVALVVVTHDLAVARRIGDEVAVMYLGRIVERAPSDELFARPQHPYTVGLIEASPTAEPGRLAPTLQGEPPSPFAPTVGCAFASRCAHMRSVCAEPQWLMPTRLDAPRAVACAVRPFADDEVTAR